MFNLSGRGDSLFLSWWMRRFGEGISAVAILSLSATHVGAESIDGRTAPVRRIMVGTPGADGTAPKAGTSGPAVDLGLGGTVTAPQPDRPAVELSSTGGKGGGITFTDFVTMSGGAGGPGGEVTYRHNGSVEASTTAPTKGVPLIWLLSAGGVGGNGPGTGNGRLSRSGAGGAGGGVSATINKDLGTTAANNAAIRATSQGGDAGGAMGDSIYPWNGSGGAGGTGGKAAVTIDGKASVTTLGHNAPAVVVESLGGNGSRLLTRAPGGGGAGGGSLGNTLADPAVRFVNRGWVSTEGDHAVAVVLQSIGGNGGGSYNIGPGGAGGAGGYVRAENPGTIMTSGDLSYGIVAQSVGGSGGKGADGILFGDRGGAAGQGGGITVANSGLVVTSGLGSSAILAQSVGGGNALDAFQPKALTLKELTDGTGGGAGGSGGILFFGKGGEGGSGGNGGSVEVIQRGTIWTEGDDAAGIVAQSIGGGGGNGGTARSFGAFLSFAVGGAGGGGGDGGHVLVTGSRNPDAPATIDTWGDRSYGLFAQSVGGGGGVGGSASSNAAGVLGSFALAVGGAGGKGGNGGRVEAYNHSEITTAGAGSGGIFAESIGGGGGLAGAANSYSLSIGLPQYPTVTLSVAVGGSGGDGGNGGYVTVGNLAAVTTYGAGAIGIEALSTGGGGGKADTGAATSNFVGLSLDTALTVGVGGSGGGGGKGGRVEVTNDALVHTFGEFATGISAASIGGGGGSAGTGQTAASQGFSWSDMADAAVKSFKLANSFTLSPTVGGTGGDGGVGGAVVLTNRATVQTGASNATAIFAQSVGGGGGTAGGFLGQGSGTAALDFQIGGKGGKGGAGGTVEVTNAKGASIRTDGAGSHGILAQSVGGGGGVGGTFAGERKSAPGFEESLRLIGDKIASIIRDEPSLAGNDELKAIVTQLGKEGAKAYKTLDALKGYLSSSKDKDDDKPATRKKKALNAAKALFSAVSALGKDDPIAQKILKSSYFVALAAAQYKFTDKIKELNQDVLKSKDATKLPKVSVDFTLGGTGGGGGAGDAVTVTNAGTIETHGASAFGILAQSIGGGGGAGGAGFTSGENVMNVNLTFGGKGEAGGAGGTTTVTNSSTITTHGDMAYGIFAQSVAGGGGVGGASANANSFSVSANLTFGRTGGLSADGGLATVTNSGTVETKGAGAHAVVAQSVGGGGGAYFIQQAKPKEPLSFLRSPDPEEQEALDALVGMLTKLGVAPPAGLATYDDDTTIIPAPGLNLNFGANGTGGGNGGRAEVTHSGTILTHGPGSFGIFAQSIGGGGGFGGSAAGGGTLQGYAAFGGKGGAAGNGGAVTVQFDGTSSIATDGVGSHAVFAQSVGGGGGYGGMGNIGVSAKSWPAFVADDGSSGNGGAITIKTKPGASVEIATTGAAAHGIFAQSLGGGGGLITDPDGARVELSSNLDGRKQANGTGGAITINVAGNIATPGDNAYAIFAQSGVQKADGTIDPRRRGGSINIDVHGKAHGGSEAGAGIRIDGGFANVLAVQRGGAVSAESGQAIQTVASGGTIRNAGTIKGNIDANGYDLENLGTGTIVTGARVNLGGSIARSAGIFDVRGTGTIASTDLTGYFMLERAGTLQVDVSAATGSGVLASDLLHVTKEAYIAGTVRPNIVGGLLPGNYTFLRSDETLRVPGTASATPATLQSGSVPVTWQLVQAGNSLSLSPKANFADPAGVALSADQKAVAGQVQQAWDSRSIGQSPLFARFASTISQRGYGADLSELTPEANQYASMTNMLRTRSGLKAVMSCPGFVPGSALLQEGDCVWGRVTGTLNRHGTSHDDSGYRQSGLTYRIGLQREFASDWFFGLSGGYTAAERTIPDGISLTRENAGDVSAALKHQIGPWQFALSGNLGIGRLANRRSIDFDENRWLARSRADVLSAAGRFRVSHQFVFGDWYAKPYLDLDVVHDRVSRYGEYGAPGYNLDVEGINKTLFVANPAIEIGGRLEAAGVTFRPYASVGMSFLSSDRVVGTARLQGAPAAVASFQTVARTPDTLADLGLGLQAISVGGFEVTAEYHAQLGRDFTGQMGSARLSYRF